MPDPSIQALENLAGAVTQLADALEPEFSSKASPKAGLSPARSAKLAGDLAKAATALRSAGAALTEYAGTCSKDAASLPSKADLARALTQSPQPGRSEG